jgi:hypothetical protein
VVDLRFPKFKFLLWIIRPDHAVASYVRFNFHPDGHSRALP